MFNKLKGYLSVTPDRLKEYFTETPNKNHSDKLLASLPSTEFRHRLSIILILLSHGRTMSEIHDTLHPEDIEVRTALTSRLNWKLVSKELIELGIKIPTRLNPHVNKSEEVQVITTPSAITELYGLGLIGSWLYLTHLMATRKHINEHHLAIFDNEDCVLIALQHNLKAIL